MSACGQRCCSQTFLSFLPDPESILLFKDERDPERLSLHVFIGEVCKILHFRTSRHISGEPLRWKSCTLRRFGLFFVCLFVVVFFYLFPPKTGHILRRSRRWRASPPHWTLWCWQFPQRPTGPRFHRTSSGRWSAVGENEAIGVTTLQRAGGKKPRNRRKTTIDMHATVRAMRHFSHMHCTPNFATVVRSPADFWQCIRGLVHPCNVKCIYALKTQLSYHLINISTFALIY